jgi:hypothetical protein
MMVVGYTATELLITGVYTTHHHRSAVHTYLISNVASFYNTPDRQNNRSAPSLIIFVLFSIKGNSWFFLISWGDAESQPKEEKKHRWDDRGPSILIDRPTLRHWRIRHYTFSIPVVNQQLLT